MKNTLEKITEAFRQLDDNTIKEDEALIIIAHTHDGEHITAWAGKGIDLVATLAGTMYKNSVFEEAVKLAISTLVDYRKQNGQPKDEAENEAEDKK